MTVKVRKTLTYGDSLYLPFGKRKGHYYAMKHISLFGYFIHYNWDLGLETNLEKPK